MKTKRIGSNVIGAVVIVTLVFAGIALAQLGGSNFEIDIDANLTIEGAAPPALD